MVQFAAELVVTLPPPVTSGGSDATSDSGRSDLCNPFNPELTSDYFDAVEIIAYNADRMRTIDFVLWMSEDEQLRRPTQGTMSTDEFQFMFSFWYGWYSKFKPSMVYSDAATGRWIAVTTQLHYWTVADAEPWWEWWKVPGDSMFLTESTDSETQTEAATQTKRPADRPPPTVDSRISIEEEF